MPTSQTHAQHRVSLREVTREDFPALFAIQLDPAGNDMAAVNPRGHDEFFSIWEQHLVNPEIVARVILWDGELAGSISRFPRDGRAMVGYWIDRARWGMGIASEGLRQFVQIVTERPLYARVAAHNAGSLRVLEKCGFAVVGREWGAATARLRACEEVQLVLAPPEG